jgi:hypothetical protein
MMRCAIVLSLGVAVTAFAGEPCGLWEQITVPSPGANINTLRAVTTVGGIPIAVGSTGGVPLSPYIVRLENGSWVDLGDPDLSNLPSPAPDFLGIASGNSGDSFWIGGSVDDLRPFTIDLPVVARFRNGGWESAEVVALPTTTAGAPRGGEINAMASFGEQVWAVGIANGLDVSATSLPMILHFDGNEWSEEYPAFGGNRINELFDVIAFGENDVWAVGESRNAGGAFLPLIVHWDGSVWSYITTPAHVGQTFLRAIDGVSGDDFWIVGETPGAGLFMRYNGSSFSVAQSPVNTTTRVSEVVALPNGQAWAHSILDIPTAFFFDGSAWSVGVWAQPPQGTRVVNDFARSGDGAVAVGSIITGGPSVAYSATLACAAAPCPGDTNGDNIVNFADLNAVLSSFGQTGLGLPADLNGDGVVNFTDLNAVLSAFGASCG